jgi:hypothetical protein
LAKHAVSVGSDLSVAVSENLSCQIEIERCSCPNFNRLGKGHVLRHRSIAFSAAFGVLKIFNLKLAL